MQIKSNNVPPKKLKKKQKKNKKKQIKAIVCKMKTNRKKNSNADYLKDNLSGGFPIIISLNGIRAFSKAEGASEV